MGYADTWKWRMEGESGSVAEHREFWSRVVGMAARATIAPRELGADDPSLTAAPLAAMVHSLGFPTTTSVVVPPLPTRPPLWIGALILMLLLGEWTSRRMRGDS